ncbi:hypothetical protein CLV58_109159 [Spirosoma oryzae]|uniref:Uncharacterized protein n=1 Tax=Spirosoma oryzae TaxID=1469603 RepID=A0A2T0SYD6_9BACT|nr:hypothetical protein [Spirosoma oryzae]PRY38432.1 hypothetical protein CLV58_109159 [Spirosoma oryzae]
MNGLEREQTIQYIIENAGGFEGKTPDEIRQYLLEKGDGFIQTLARGLIRDYYFGPESRL